MRVALTIAALALFAPAAAVAASPKPSFDCAKAETQVEKTICGDVLLAKADAEVAAIYRDRRRELAPAAAKRLAEDETEFLGSRERVFGYGMGEPPKLLLALLADRADFLRRLRVPEGDALVGTWSNVANTVTVSAQADGRLGIDVNGNEPVTARWVCGVQGMAQPANGVLEVTVEDGSKLRLSRDGQILTMQALKPPNKTSWTPGYCGLNGSVEGSYFAAAPAKR